MPIVAALPFIIPAVASLGTAALGARASGRAANQQATAGGQAIVANDAAVNMGNPLIESAAATSNEGVVNTADQAATGVTEAGARAGEILTGAASQAGTDLRGTSSTAGANLRGAATDANALLAPYLQGGEAGMASLLELLQGPGSQFKFDPNEDPGARYRMEQAYKAIQKSAALRGGLTSTSTLKALQTRGSDLGAQEYQAAFERFHKGRELTGRLATGAAQLGQSSAERAGANTLMANERSGMWDVDASKQAGSWNTNAAQQAGQWNTNAAQNAGEFRTRGSEFAGTMNFNQALARSNNMIRGAQYSGNALMNIGNANAAGTMGSANAWAGGIKGVSDAATDWLGMRKKKGPYGGLPDDNGVYG